MSSDAQHASTAGPPPQADAVVLLSGGLDSCVALATARRAGQRCATLSFDYGQRHRHELISALRISSDLGAIRHVTLSLDLRAFGGSALTSDIPVPKSAGDAGPWPAKPERASATIPLTYVPARNLVFLSLAVGWAEALGAAEVVIGVNAIDYSGYPDCRPEFIEAFSRASSLATRVGVEGKPIRISTPLIRLSKAEIIRVGVEAGAPLAQTHSCYDPLPEAAGRVVACGRCESCQIRARGFRDAGVPDPTRYA
ncbi:MAG: 7-cyano-7-deazaguanine synthase QueC [Planctomycetota bacterium]|nr:7-cyano-7-deazaguanine synthase QueC [Planctomycetota bacterium]